MNLQPVSALFAELCAVTGADDALRRRLWACLDKYEIAPRAAHLSFAASCRQFLYASAWTACPPARSKTTPTCCACLAGTPARKRLPASRLRTCAVSYPICRPIAAYNPTAPPPTSTVCARSSHGWCVRNRSHAPPETRSARPNPTGCARASPCARTASSVPGKPAPHCANSCYSSCCCPPAAACPSWPTCRRRRSTCRRGR